MRITCPTCAAQYDVDEDDIEVEGQDVQCSDCLTIWMQTRDGEATNPRPAEALAEGETIAEDSAEVEIGDAGTENVTEVHDEVSEDVTSEEDGEVTEVTDEAEEDTFSENVEHVTFGAVSEDTQDDATDEGYTEDDISIDTESSEITEDDFEAVIEAPTFEDEKSSDTQDDATPDYDADNDEPSKEEPEDTPEIAQAPTWSGIAALADDVVSDEDAETNDTGETPDIALDNELNDILEDTLDIDIEDDPIAFENSVENAAQGAEGFEEGTDEGIDSKDKKSWGGISSLVAAGAAAVGLSGNEKDDDVTQKPDSQDDETTVDNTEQALDKFEETDDDDDPIWAEIAEMAKGSEDAMAEEKNDDLHEQSPPIQSEPVIVGDVPANPTENDDDEHPWEVSAQDDDEFSDFIWSDPSKSPENSPEVEEDFDVSTLSETIPTLDESKGNGVKNEIEIDDDELSKILNEQMAIEDNLDGGPTPSGIAVDGVPEELIGRRARVPDINALKTSLLSTSIPLTEEEFAVLKPVRRFRRGFLLAILIFLIFLSVYVGRTQLGNLVPAIAPILDSYASVVDFLRLKAEALNDTIITLFGQGVDWVMVKINGA